MKIGVWPGTGFEWQMVSTFSVRIFRTFQDEPFISENFRSGKSKRSYHLHPNRNFRNFLVNGKQPVFFSPLRTKDAFLKFIEGSKYRQYSVAEEMSTSRSLKMRGTVPFDEQEIYMAENLR